MIQEVWKCDRHECEEESPPCLDQPPFGWVEVKRFGLDEASDVELHFCGWECALHGTNVQLAVEEREMESDHEAH